VSTPRVSVIMSVYNKCPYLAVAIESILNQTFFDFEFIILNDGSSDGSEKIIDHYARQDHRVRVLSQSNSGIVVSLNRLIKEARGEFVALMDADDRCKPERLEKQLAFMDMNPDYGVIGSQTIFFDNSGREWTADFKYPLNGDDFVVALPDKPLINHPAVLFRTRALLAVNGYRAQFTYAEDYDLWCRLSEITKLASLPEAYSYYRRHADQISSKHVIKQTLYAAIAWLSYQERASGSMDPIDGLNELPRIEEVDKIFSIPNAAQYCRMKIVSRILYDKHALSGEGFGILIECLRNGGVVSEPWRLVLRLFKFRLLMRSLTLLMVLLNVKVKRAYDLT